MLQSGCTYEAKENTSTSKELLRLSNYFCSSFVIFLEVLFHLLIVNGRISERELVYILMNMRLNQYFFILNVSFNKWKCVIDFYLKLSGP